MFLTSLPDCKVFHEHLTKGKSYTVLRTIGNGVVIQTDDPELQIILLASRLGDTMLYDSPVQADHQGSVTTKPPPTLDPLLA